MDMFPKWKTAWFVLMHWSFRYHDTLLWKLLEVSTYFLRLELLTENLVRFLYIHLPSTMLQELFMIWAAVYVWFPYSAHWVLSSIPSKYLPMGMVVYTASSNLLWFSLRSVYLISPYMSIVWWTRSIILIQKDSVYLWRSCHVSVLNGFNYLVIEGLIYCCGIFEDLALFDVCLIGLLEVSRCGIFSDGWY